LKGSLKVTTLLTEKEMLRDIDDLNGDIRHTSEKVYDVQHPKI
jgi:hypothetical protein